MTKVQRANQNSLLCCDVNPQLGSLLDADHCCALPGSEGASTPWLLVGFGGPSLWAAAGHMPVARTNAWWPQLMLVLCVGSAWLAVLCTGPGTGGPVGSGFTHRYHVYLVCSQSQLLALEQVCPWNANQAQTSTNVPVRTRGSCSAVIPRARDWPLLPATRSTDLEGAEGVESPVLPTPAHSCQCVGSLLGLVHPLGRYFAEFGMLISRDKGEVGCYSSIESSAREMCNLTIHLCPWEKKCYHLHLSVFNLVAFGNSAQS